MTGLTLDTAGALAASREMGATGWAAAELLLALRIGMAEGYAAQHEAVPTGNERYPITPNAS
ncbi:hypothetical protein [Roseococcus microcysteis]|uniref:hypothetical protein n=1 Tax=Roseococcus microcysteis TaxID=2771361 RepID=UPI00168A4E7A|nr:hypothetical protein [Roseococcus microcysteis]